VADHPLKSAKDLWLGKLLPYQLPNPTQAYLIAKLFFIKKLFGIIILQLIIEVNIVIPNY
jgi:hypothetical protein